MLLKDILELVIVISAALMIVVNSFKTSKRMDKDAGHFRELCRMRHNPMDRDLVEIKQELKRHGKILCRVDAIICRGNKG